MHLLLKVFRMFDIVLSSRKVVCPMFYNGALNLFCLPLHSPYYYICSSSRCFQHSVARSTKWSVYIMVKCDYLLQQASQPVSYQLYRGMKHTVDNIDPWCIHKSRINLSCYIVVTYVLDIIGHPDRAFNEGRDKSFHNIGIYETLFFQLQNVETLENMTYL